MSWASRALSLALRRELAYRAAFWIQFVMSSATEIGVAWFVWHAVFEASGAERIGGFTFREMAYYVLLASASSRCTYGTGSWTLSEEIYSGTLNRYLVYPIPLFRYFYVQHFSGQVMRLIQSTACIAIAAALLGPPPIGVLSPVAIVAGVGAILVAGVLVFQLFLLIELIAFWQDVVWNLFTMLRFLVQLLGGALVPIALFPEWGRAAVTFTPFPLLVSFPARCLLGQVGAAEWISSAGLAVGWSVALALAARALWYHGSRRYSGTGI